MMNDIADHQIDGQGGWHGRTLSRRAVQEQSQDDEARERAQNPGKRLVTGKGGTVASIMCFHRLCLYRFTLCYDELGGQFA